MKTELNKKEFHITRMSTDDDLWPKSFPDLMRLDELLRCGICYDHVKTALVTPCSHNFCSLCIRKYMQYKTSCPACFLETTENQLRNNRVLDEMVALVERLKKPLCDALHGIAPVFDQQKPVSIVSQAFDTAESVVQTLNAEVPACSSNDAVECPLSPRGPSGLENPLKQVKTVAQMLMSPSKKAGPSSAPASPVKAKSSTNKLSFSKSVVKMVPCPVCSVDIPERNINFHLDACLKNAGKAPVQRNPDGKASSNGRRPLPKLVYRLMQEKDLRKKLAELKLSTQGDRKMLEKRHQRYTVLYNSECDSDNPRPVSDIVKQVEREEREENRSNSKTWTTLQVDRKSDSKTIDDAYTKYRMENKSSFDSLIADLRRREQQKKKASTVTSEACSSSSNDSTFNVPSQEQSDVDEITIINTNLKNKQTNSRIDSIFSDSDTAPTNSSSNLVSKQVNRQPSPSLLTQPLNYSTPNLITKEADSQLSPSLLSQSLNKSSPNVIKKRNNRQPSPSLLTQPLNYSTPNLITKEADSQLSPSLPSQSLNNSSPNVINKRINRQPSPSLLTQPSIISTTNLITKEADSQLSPSLPSQSLNNSSPNVINKRINRQPSPSLLTQSLNYSTTNLITKEADSQLSPSLLSQSLNKSSPNVIKKRHKQSSRRSLSLPNSSSTNLVGRKINGETSSVSQIYNSFAGAISPDISPVMDKSDLKSPVLGKKKLFETERQIVEVSDDSNSTVFSAGDFDEIDAVISQHNLSLSQVIPDVAKDANSTDSETHFETSPRVPQSKKRQKKRTKDVHVPRRSKRAKTKC